MKNKMILYTVSISIADAVFFDKGLISKLWDDLIISLKIDGRYATYISQDSFNREKYTLYDSNKFVRIT